MIAEFPVNDIPAELSDQVPIIDIDDGTEARERVDGAEAVGRIDRHAGDPRRAAGEAAAATTEPATTAAEAATPTPRRRQRRGHLLIRNVGLNDTRTAMLGVLLRMGAQVREAVEDVEC